MVLVSGHVHIIAGDVTRLVCDAWLLPTDEVFRVSPSFASAVGVEPNACLPGLSWNGERVVRLPRVDSATNSLPHIWLGDVGRSNEEATWYAEIVEPFVEAALGAVAPQPGVRPLLAMNVVGTGHGGMAADKGDIHEALLPALHSAAKNHDTDLALVCWRRRSYSAAQRVRRRLLIQHHGGDIGAMWNLGPRRETLEPVAKRLAAAVRRRDAVLFLGAGVSAGAGLPAWQGLLDSLAAELGPGVPIERLRRLDVRDQAALLERRLCNSGTTLHSAIAKHIDRTRYALAHGHLASLPVREIVTTNYDRLIETAVEPVDGKMAVLPYEAVAPDQRWLLKLHGSIDRDDSVVLTRSDYLSIPARHSALFGLVQAMLLTRHMIFIGYSLSDEDFHQVVHDVRQARAGGDHGHLGTVLALFDDPLFAELWADDLEVVAVADEPAAKPTQREVGEAVRQLQILLDLIAFEAADLDAFLLDDTYRALLSDAERTLADDLAPLAAHMRAVEPADVPAVERVRGLLEELGAQALWSRPHNVLDR